MERRFASPSAPFLFGSPWPRILPGPHFVPCGACRPSQGDRHAPETLGKILIFPKTHYAAGIASTVSSQVRSLAWVDSFLRWTALSAFRVAALTVMVYWLPSLPAPLV